MRFNLTSVGRIARPLCLAFLSVACVPAPDLPTARDSVSTMTCGSHWRPLDALPMAPRRFPSITPTAWGTVLVGGLGNDGPRSDAWRWDGVRWHALALDGAPSARIHHTAVWTGDRLCVWGGEAHGTSLADGACWNPHTDRWTPMSHEGAPSPRAAAGACAHHHGMLLFGGRDDDGNTLGDTYFYDPQADRWTTLEGPHAPHPRARAVLIPWHDDALLWGGVGDELALGAQDAARWSSVARAWQPLDDDGPRLSHGPVAFAFEPGLLAVSSREVGVFLRGEDRWRVSPNTRGLADGAAITALPSGVFVWGGRDGDTHLATGACWDHRTLQWTPSPEHDAPAPRTDAVAFDDGAAMIVLWGDDGRGLRADGAALVR